MDPEFVTHTLNVDPSFPLKKQKLRRSAKQHVEVVKQEVEKLKQAGPIKKVFFRNGYLTPWWLKGRMVNGRYVWTLPTSTGRALRTCFQCRRLIS